VEFVDGARIAVTPQRRRTVFIALRNDQPPVGARTTVAYSPLPKLSDRDRPVYASLTQVVRVRYNKTESFCRRTTLSVTQVVGDRSVATDKCPLTSALTRWGCRIAHRL